MPKRQLFIIGREAMNSLNFDETDAICADLKELDLYHLPFEEVDIRVFGDALTYSEVKDVRLISEAMKGMLARGYLELTRDAHGKPFYITHFGEGYWLDFRNISLKHTNYTKWSVMEGVRGMENSEIAYHKKFPALEIPPGRRTENSHSDFGWLPSERERDAIAHALIALLATKNVVKSIKHNPLAKHGIGAKKNSTKRYEYVTTISVPRELPKDEEHKPSGNERAPHLRRGHIRRQHYGPGNELIKKIFIAPIFVNADKTWVKQRTAYNVSF
jgi:hypothetical protein